MWLARSSSSFFLRRPWGLCAAQILITKMVVEHWGGSFFYPNVGFILARLPLFWVSYYFWRLGI